MPRKRKPKPEPDPQLERAKQASLAQTLFKAARLLDEQAVARVRARTGQGLRRAHTSLFPHIDLEGTRLTELARRLGISKQAVGQLVDELEDMGTLERIPDPADGRAKLIRFRGGTGPIMEGLKILGELEAEISEELGPRRSARLHRDLLRLLELLEARDEVKAG